MKRLLLLFAFLLCLHVPAAHAQTPPPVAHCIHDNSGGGTTSSCTLNSLGHNQLVLSGGWFYGGAGTTPVSDTFGLTWTPVGPLCAIFRGGPANDWIGLYYAYTGSNSGNDTITNSAISSASIVAVAYNTGESSGAPFGSHCANGTASGAGTVSSGTFTSSSSALVVGLGENVTTGSAPTAGSGFVLSFTPMGAVVSGMSPWLPFEQQLGSATQTTMNIDSGSSGQIWQMLGASFPTALGGVLRHPTGFY